MEDVAAFSPLEQKPPEPKSERSAQDNSKCWLRVVSTSGQVLLHGSVNCSTTVASVKEDIEASEGIPVREQLLAIGGAPIANTDVLRNFMFADGGDGAVETSEAAPESADEVLDVVLRRSSPEWPQLINDVGSGHCGFEHTRARVRAKTKATQQYSGDCGVHLASLVQDMNTVFQAASMKVTESGSSLLAAAGDLQRNRDTVFEVVPRSSKGCRQAAEKLTLCRNSVLVAVQTNGQVLLSMQQDLGPVHKAVTKGLRTTAEAVQQAKEAWRQEGELLRFAKVRGWLYADVAEDLVGSYMDSLKAITSDSSALEATVEAVSLCRQAYRRAVVVNRNVIRQAETSLQRDQEVIFGWAADHVSEFRKCDRQFIMTVIEANGEALERAPDEFKRDREVVLLAVRQSGGWALQFAADEMKCDQEVVMSAVRRNGWALEHAGPELKRDRDVVMAAVQANGEALEWAAEPLKADREIVLTAMLRSGGWALQVAADELRADPEIAAVAINQNSLILEHVSKDLQNDWVLVLSAVQANGLALEHASEQLRNDRSTVEAAVRSNPASFRFASPLLRADRQVVRDIVKRDGFLLQYATAELQKDSAVVLEAVAEGGTGVLEFAAPELRSDPQLVAVAVVSSQRKMHMGDGASSSMGGEPAVPSWNDNRDGPDLVQL